MTAELTGRYDAVIYCFPSTQVMMPRGLTQLDDRLWFPCAADALDEPNGLLAIGGDLSPARLSLAYRSGIFPWYGQHHPILWWSPDPRCVLRPEALHISRSLQKRLKRQDLVVTLNTAFHAVVDGCAGPRRDTDDTWITTELKQSYAFLHHSGMAHSVEVWKEGQLAGGLYGISIGQLFCGESMFSAQRDCSKVAMVALCQHFQRHGGKLIDCQMQTDHLGSLGAQECPRDAFLEMLYQLRERSVTADCWVPQRIIYDRNSLENRLDP